MLLVTCTESITSVISSRWTMFVERSRSLQSVSFCLQAELCLHAHVHSKICALAPSRSPPTASLTLLWTSLVSAWLTLLLGNYPRLERRGAVVWGGGHSLETFASRWVVSFTTCEYHRVSQSKIKSVQINLFSVKIEPLILLSGSVLIEN